MGAQVDLWLYRGDFKTKKCCALDKERFCMTGSNIIDQTVGGLSIVILLTLVVFAYGYPYASQNDDDTKAPFGEDSRLFWNIFVGLTTVVLVLVVVVGFLVPCTGRAGRPRHVQVMPGGPAPIEMEDISFMSTGSGYSLGGGDKLGSDLDTPSSFSTMSKSANDSFSFSSIASDDISTSLKALSESSSSMSLSI